MINKINLEVLKGGRIEKKDLFTNIYAISKELYSALPDERENIYKTGCLRTQKMFVLEEFSFIHGNQQVFIHEYHNLEHLNKLAFSLF